MSVLSQLVESLQAFPGHLIDIAAQGPIAAILVLLGALVMAVAMGVFGILALAGLAKLLNPTSGPTTRRPPTE